MTTIVLFCDICNESVPQSDVDSGRARLLKGGRVVCSVCDRSMSAPASETEPTAAAPGPAPTPAPSPAAAPPPRAAEVARHRPRRDNGALVGASLALMAVLVAVGVGLRLSWDIEDSKLAYADALREAQLDYRVNAQGVRRTVEELRRENRDYLRSLQEALDDFGGDLAAADERWQRENRNLMAELVDVDSELTEMKDLIGLIERHDKEMIGLQAKFAALLDDVTKHSVRIASLEERPVVTIQEPLAASGDAGSSGGPNGASAPPAWTKLLVGLDSPNADERWMAVDELGQTGDPEVAGALVRMLQDEDTFVRMATARILGDLAAPVGIPALIGALEDAEPAVREASLVGLQAITGRTLDFDPHAGPADRAKRVKAWQKWWEKEQEDWLPED